MYNQFRYTTYHKFCIQTESLKLKFKLKQSNKYYSVMYIYILNKCKIWRQAGKHYLMFYHKTIILTESAKINQQQQKSHYNYIGPFMIIIIYTSFEINDFARLC